MSPLSASDTGKPNFQYVFPHATGEAQATVERHQQQSEIVLYGSWVTGLLPRSHSESLIKTQFCPFTQRVWIALEERGISYQYVEINPFKKEPVSFATNSAPYRAHHPS